MSSHKKVKTVSILGCGWYGLALAKQLITNGYKVRGSSTTAEKLITLNELQIEPYHVNFEAEKEIYDPSFFDCDVLVISIPPKRSHGEAALYPEKIKRINEAACKHQVKRLLFISSTSVYGDCNKEVTEDHIPVPDSESGKAILTAENILLKSEAHLTTIVRFGGLIGPGRDPARFFTGKKNIPNGKAPVNLIHLEDCVTLTLEVIKNDAFGHTFNACSSEHPARMDFYTKAAANSKMEIPEFIDELTTWKIISSAYLESVLGISIGPLSRFSG